MARGAEDATFVEQMVVTGSRLEQGVLDGPSPVQLYTAEDLRKSGVNTLNDFIRYLPQNAGQFSEAQAMTRGFEGAGFLDLRGIGIDATLTLVNGRRVAPYAQGGGQTQPFVDVNAIPMAAIERIEILKDGASAIYGADAVAGVVNIILKDDFDGFAASVGALTASEGDGEEYRADVLWGRQGERTRVMAGLTVLDKAPIAGRDRPWSDDVDFTDVGGPNLRSFNSQPTTYQRLDTFESIPDPECGVDPQISGVSPTPFGDFCRFNFARFAALTFDRRTVGGTLAVEHDFDEALTGRVDLLLNHNENESEIAPSLTFSGFVPPNHPGNFLGAPLGIAARPLELGNRITETESTTWRLAAELEGRAAGWNWLASGFTSGNDVDSLQRNLLDERAFGAALLGLGGPNGDQFFDPFGASPSNPPEVVDGFRANVNVGSETREHAAEFQATRYFGALPGGSVGLVVGAQLRRQELDESADARALSGDLAGPPTTLVEADRDVRSAYVELSVPVHDALEVQLAARIDDYSDFGSAANPKVAFAWTPTPSWLVRGSFSGSFRPPSFTELFAGAVERPAFVVDTVRCSATGAQADCLPLQVPEDLAGNPALDAETGESRFLGVAFTPDRVPGLRLQLDLWSFEHEDRIVAVAPQIVIDTFGEIGITRADPTPDDVALGLPGRITRVARLTQNTDRLRTQGFDTTVTYVRDTDRYGRFALSVVHTYLDEYDIEAPGSGAPAAVDFAGRVFESPLPEHRGNATLAWNRGRHGLSGTFRYVDGFTDSIFGVEVDHFRSLDLQYSFELPEEQLRFQIGCSNCTDEGPPLQFGVQGPGLYDLRGALLFARIDYGL